MTRRTLIPAAVLLFAIAGCSSGTSTPAAAPTSQAGTTSSQPPATCNLKSQGDVLLRLVVPNGPTTAQRVGGVDLALCKLTFDTLAQTTSTDAGFCTTAAWAADNPNYNADAVPAPPLEKIQAQAGAACG